MVWYSLPLRKTTVNVANLLHPSNKDPLVSDRAFDSVCTAFVVGVWHCLCLLFPSYKKDFCGVCFFFFLLAVISLFSFHCLSFVMVGRDFEIIYETLQDLLISQLKKNNRCQIAKYCSILLRTQCPHNYFHHTSDHFCIWLYLH